MDSDKMKLYVPAAANLVPPVNTDEARKLYRELHYEGTPTSTPGISYMLDHIEDAGYLYPGRVLPASMSAWIISGPTSTKRWCGETRPPRTSPRNWKPTATKIWRNGKPSSTRTWPDLSKTRQTPCAQPEAAFPWVARPPAAARRSPSLCLFDDRGV